MKRLLLLLVLLAAILAASFIKPKSSVKAQTPTQTLQTSNLSLQGGGNSTRPMPAPSTSPDDVVRQFYAWYLKARFPEPNHKNSASFRKYVTQRFLKRAMDPNVDVAVFIDAQDSDATWAKNFDVAKATIHGQTATTEVTLTGERIHYKLSVTLRREGGAWKIDGVKGKDWKDVG